MDRVKLPYSQFSAWVFCCSLGMEKQFPPRVFLQPWADALQWWGAEGSARSGAPALAQSSDMTEVWPEGCALCSACRQSSECNPTVLSLWKSLQGLTLPGTGLLSSAELYRKWVCLLPEKIIWHMYRRQKLSMAGWGWFLVEVVHRLQKSKEMPWLWSVVLGLLKLIM